MVRPLNMRLRRLLIFLLNLTVTLSLPASASTLP